ncbi:MAG: primosomal protein N' [Planctomycetaceae bacterium]
MSNPSQKQLFEPAAIPPPPAPWEIAEAEDRLAAQLVFNRPLDTPYHYLVPDDLRSMIRPGQRVRAPFGKGDRATVGYCVGVGPVPETSRSLKTIHEVMDREPLLSPRMLELTKWMADYYLCGWGQVLETVVPAGVKNQAGTRIVSAYRISPVGTAALHAEKLSQKQRTVLEVLAEANRPLGVEDLTAAADCGTGPITALRRKGFIHALRRRTEAFETDVGEVAREPDIPLNRDQATVLGSIVDVLREQKHRTILLHGVTGSGKTEVYIQAIREVVSYGRQAIVLVPEISLTPQTIRRFRCRFDSVAVLHSHLSDAERHWHWQQIARGAVQVVVGARSAVFAPTPHLGLIVIDEEHESSFKQEAVPRYHARDVARKRAEIEGVPLVLGSATPMLESYLRARRGVDLLMQLPRRVEKRPLPPVIVIDVRNDPHCSRGAAIGRALDTAMRGALDDGGQVILFQNLRGYSPAIWCRACGETVKCPQCDITLTWHKDRGLTVCHSCDFEAAPPARCPACGHAGLRYLGIGTQRLEQEVKARFPKYACLRMDSDSMKGHGSHDRALESFRKGEVKILVGTQMIAKGLDFPNVTLVGVINADTMLHQPDLRSSERTFQLISQVAGRTGRGALGGRVLVQTFAPSEPAIVFAAAHDYQGFASQELRHRQERGAPPFQQLVRIILRGEREELVQNHAQQMADVFRKLIESEKLPVRLLGPARAPVSRLQGRYRYHFQLASDSQGANLELWRKASPLLERSSEVEFVVDVDPISMR